jgi:hypothetical protein
MKNQKSEITSEDLWDYYIDDSKMPSPEEVENFPDTSEIDKEADKGFEKIAKELGL